jgi:hypothetical protein
MGIAPGTGQRFSSCSNRGQGMGTRPPRTQPLSPNGAHRAAEPRDRSRIPDDPVVPVPSPTSCAVFLWSGRSRSATFFCVTSLSRVKSAPSFRMACWCSRSGSCRCLATSCRRPASRPAGAAATPTPGARWLASRQRLSLPSPSPAPGRRRVRPCRGLFRVRQVVAEPVVQARRQRLSLLLLLGPDTHSISKRSTISSDPSQRRRWSE